MIDGHGNDLSLYGDRVRIDFSSNIAFNNHSAAILAHLKGKLPAVLNYPDPKASTLRTLIAHHHGVKPANVLVTNGSAEAFYVAAHWLRGEDVRSLIFVPSFAEYEDSCNAHGHRVDFLPLSDFDRADYAAYRSVWVGFPNNPDGRRVPLTQIESLAHRCPHCCFVVDAAYDELSASSETQRMDCLPPNLLLVHSLTKTFGIPGLRIGYLLAEGSIVEQMERLKTPWSVNALALKAGEYIMTYYEDLAANKAELLAESIRLQRNVAAIAGFHVVPSDCNFFLCELTNGHTAAELHRYLLEQHGILIRNASNFRGLTDRHFRLAVQANVANNQLLNALKQWTTIL